ncbi:DNA polymerase zeta catalytic subunit [Teleopsis dalmanni]|uniref:DNA polymerase zeta catalytic subunit n=1 Tax=Teleopsis dalmanni TaxID=139649 RepID=UPI0018CD7D11|nr:DNA polymerase zeta catalytic subunit [Teleopsis dalmanni]
MSAANGVFSIRLVVADFYLDKPTYGLDPCYSEFRGKQIKRVPIIRIFGANANGQKSCMHIHGVFPYFYIPYDPKDFDSPNKAFYQIATNIDKAINISLGQGSSEAQHVFKVQLVKGIPFYGYHRTEHQYFKVYMFNPRFVRRAANLLQNGGIMGKIFHPHESHVPYILQFMIDYNLYGMSFLHVPLDIVKFRKSCDTDEIPISGIVDAQVLDCSTIKKQTVSLIEVDIGSNFILNRFQLLAKNNSIHTNPGIEAIWQDESLRRQKLKQNLANDEEQTKEIPPLKVPDTQERPFVQIAESDAFYRAGLFSKLIPLEMSTSDQTINSTIASSLSTTILNKPEISQKEQKRTFNLKKLIANAVYPEECSQNDNLINASYIENHLPNNSIFKANSDDFNQELLPDANNSENVFLEETLVDEELILNLTQTQVPLNASLRDLDIALLDVMKSLEEENEDETEKDLPNSLKRLSHQDNCREQDTTILNILQQLEEENENENQIDLDSTLAPLSQQNKNFDQSPEYLNKETTAGTISKSTLLNESDLDDDEEAKLHDFSIAMEDINEFILKFTPSQDIPLKPAREEKLEQIDGSDDILKTPPKRNGNQKLATNSTKKTTPPTTPKKLYGSSNKSPVRSPRTPRRNVASRYAPLPITITNHSEKKKSAHKSETTPTKFYNSKSIDDVKSSVESLRKRLAITELRRKSINEKLPINMDEEPTTSKMQSKQVTPKRMANPPVDFDKTHITCVLTPRRKREKRLKVYKLDQDLIPVDRTKLVEVNDNSKKTKKETDKKPTRKSTRISEKNKNLVETDNTTNKKTESADTKCTEKESTLKSTTVLEYQNNDIKIGCQAETMAIKSLSNNCKDDIEDISSTSNTQDADTGKLSEVEIQLNIKEEIINIEIESSEDMDVLNTSDQVKEKITEQLEHKEITNNVRFSGSSLTDSEEEILASDNEIETSFTKLRNTPNVKDLQPCLNTLNSILRKRRSLTSSLNVVNTTKSKNNDFVDEQSSMPDPITPVSKVKITAPCSNIRKSSKRNSLHMRLSANSPSVFSNLSSPVSSISSPSMAQICSPLTTKFNLSPGNTVIITPLELPPTYAETLEGCEKYDIKEYDYQNPYYSNPDDITKQKELGFLVLQIPGNKLNDLEEFQSIMGENLMGIAEWRRQKLVSIGGLNMLNSFRNTLRVREYFANNKSVIITPLLNPPLPYDAKIWLKARELMQNKKESVTEKMNFDEDSPIKIRRQKVTMMLNEQTGGDDSDADLDCSTSLTLTPLTPATPVDRNISKKSIRNDESTTPLTTIPEIIGSAPNSLRSLKRRLHRARVCLNKKLKIAFKAEQHNKTGCSSNSPSEQLQIDCENIKPLSQESVNSTDTSSSISSHLALAELERSSFVKNLNSDISKNVNHDISFGLSNATLNNTFGFKVNLENLQQAKSDVEYNYLTILTLEVFVPTRESLHPNPEFDEIRCIFYAIENSIPIDCTNPTGLPMKACGYIIVNNVNDLIKEGKIHGIDADIAVEVVNTEIDAIQYLLALCAKWDPDIYAGYEIEMASWGYIIERAKYLCFNIIPLLSRVPTQKVRDFVDEDRDQFTDLDVEMKLNGRILLDVWRLMRSEIALTSYSFENVMYHILHKRCPWHNFQDLTTWFASPCSRWIVIEYYLERVRGTLSLLDQLDLIGRTSEMAKLIGIQFYEVLSRGSQFRVESMMLRIGKPKNLVPLSPSVQQRAHMRAPEYLALIMEPQSRFYVDPLIVLDFQSLYPSMIIAYNYCFSTCLGRVEHLGQSSPFEFGASQLRVSPSMLRKLLDRDLITISPCGAVFVKSTVREGILPRMLTEILDTRQMVKQSMKLHKSNTALQRILHSRQLGLKLMANVTYGYTAANFSGRMPCVEVGDSVVSKGRETLENAIKIVEQNEKWNVKVVYGDTDSLFVLVPGRSREKAFQIGEEIVETITNINPHPVKLKLEKIYQPCILQTKKRYVGYMYETPDQTEPVYEAKGIETVRRDGCPAVAKMLEKVLRILFETKDVSKVKQYVCRQFTKLLSGKANLQDLIFAKEFRGLNGYKPTACVPALELTRKWMQTDPRHIPRRGERVPFIITNGPPGVPLIRLVRSPHDVLQNDGLKINAIYYITKAIIPPLNRCLLLIGADVNEWFANLPRKLLLTPALSTANEIIPQGCIQHLKKSTISQYFSTTNCIVDCGRQTKQGICSTCSKNPTKSWIQIQWKIAKIERGFHLTQQICQACCGRIGDIACGSLDCPVLYVLEMKRRDLQQIAHFHNILKNV